jgi:CxxC motif-containing protein (DUF1111 family)
LGSTDKSKEDCTAAESETQMLKASDTSIDIGVNVLELVSFTQQERLGVSTSRKLCSSCSRLCSFRLYRAGDCAGKVFVNFETMLNGEPVVLKDLFET